MSLHQDLNSLIKKGKLTEALAIVQDKLPDLHNESLLLSGQMYELDGKRMSTLITDEAYAVKKNKISMALIQMINPNDNMDQLEVAKGGASKILRVITQQLEFYKHTIKGFSYSKKILWYILTFVAIISITSILFLQDLFPERFGQILMVLTVIAFITLVVGSLGFIGAQIQLFNQQQTIIKVEDDAS